MGGQQEGAWERVRSPSSEGREEAKSAFEAQGSEVGRVHFPSINLGSSGIWGGNNEIFYSFISVFPLHF